MSENSQAVGAPVEASVRPHGQMKRAEIVAALRLIGESMGGACAQAADLLEADERIKLLPGDYFTHDRTGARFVCRAVTRHDYGGLQSVVRAEVDLAA